MEGDRMSWVMPAYSLIGPLFTLRTVLFCRINYRSPFLKPLKKLVSFFSRGRKKSLVVLIGHRAMRPLSQSSLKSHEDTVGTSQMGCLDNWKENNEVSKFSKVFIFGAFKRPYLSKARLGRQEVTHQKIKLKSAGLILLQSVLLNGVQWMRACVILSLPLIY